MDYNAPLLWEHEDGRSGLEVSQIPKDGMVFFFDAQGPVYRLGGIEEARWWRFIKVRLSDGMESRFCVTRLLRDGVYRYIVPGAVPCVVVCEGEEHAECERGQCGAIDGILQAQVALEVA